MHIVTRRGLGRAAVGRRRASRNGSGEPGGCLLSRATTAAKERWKPNNQWHMSSYDCAFMKTCLLPPSKTRRKACSPCCGAVPTTLTVVRAHLATNLPRPTRCHSKFIQTSDKINFFPITIVTYSIEGMPSFSR